MGHAQCRKRLLQRSAAFQRSHSHACGSHAGSGNGTRIEHSLEEEGHQGGPSSRQRVRILQPYFIVPGKDRGLRPILGLSQLNHSVMQLKFRILSSSWSYLRPDPRTGCQERSRRRILPISSFPITGSSLGVLWGLSISISISSLRPCTLTCTRALSRCVDTALAPL